MTDAPTSSNEPKWPAVLVLFSALLFVVASLRYPGGYDWIGQSISSLFQPQTVDGAQNTARPIAVASVAAFCVGVAVVFERISRRARSRGLRKTIQISGIGSMVYAFLVVTPMHDVLVGIALAAFIVAMLATFRLLWLGTRRGLVAAGIACMLGTVWNAVLYYGPFDSGPLPAVQKISMLLWVGWLLLVYFAAFPRARGVDGLPGAIAVNRSRGDARGAAD